MAQFNIDMMLTSRQGDGAVPAVTLKQLSSCVTVRLGVVDGSDNSVTLYLDDLRAARKLASRLCQAVGLAEGRKPAEGTS